MNVEALEKLTDLLRELDRMRAPLVAMLDSRTPRVKLGVGFAFLLEVDQALLAPVLAPELVRLDDQRRQLVEQIRAL